MKLSDITRHFQEYASDNPNEALNALAKLVENICFELEENGKTTDKINLFWQAASEFLPFEKEENYDFCIYRKQ